MSDMLNMLDFRSFAAMRQPKSEIRAGSMAEFVKWIEARAPMFRTSTQLLGSSFMGIPVKEDSRLPKSCVVLQVGDQVETIFKITDSEDHPNG